jgi:lipoprotein NlpI
VRAARPANALDLAKAGMAAQRRGDWDQAIGLYDQALASGGLPPQAVVRVAGLRANAYGAKGLPDKAIAAFTDVIKLTPNDLVPLVDRSIVYRQQGDYVRAIADDEAALKLAPDYVLGHTNRGIANFYGGHFAAAAEHFVKSRAADPAEPDFVLWLHLARARAGQDDMQELAQNAAKVDLTWAGPAVARYLGRIKPDDLSGAAAHKDLVIQRRQRCEASFYLGEDALVHGRKDEAKSRFNEVLDACAMYKLNYAYFSNVYGAAQSELNRMGQ